MADAPIIRNGKQLFMHGKLLADCASEPIAELIRIAVTGARMSKQDAAAFERVWQ